MNIQEFMDKYENEYAVGIINQSGGFIYICPFGVYKGIIETGKEFSGQHVLNQLWVIDFDRAPKLVQTTVLSQAVSGNSKIIPFTEGNVNSQVPKDLRG